MKNLMSSILKPSRADTCREKMAIWLANILIAIFCTKQYEDILRVTIALGMQELDKMVVEEKYEEEDIHE